VNLARDIASTKLFEIKRPCNAARVDPAAEHNQALRKATWREHVDTIKRLLEDPRVDPSAFDNYVIWWAAANGHVDIVERLLPDNRVSANAALRGFAGCGAVEWVDRLLRDARVDPADDDCAALLAAVEAGSASVVARLLLDVRVNPSVGNNRAVCKAAEGGHVAVLDCLLQDARVDPSAANNYAVRAAAKWWRMLQRAPNGTRTSHYAAAIDRLLLDLRVDIAGDDALCAEISDIGMVRLLFTRVCVGLHGLDLPAIVTLEILDALLPNNSVCKEAKWALIVAVKHFRTPPTLEH
jgi:hypothetical protein